MPLQTNMAGIEFQVEGAFQAGARAYVVARRLVPSAQFALSSASTLAGCRVQPWLEMPRAADASGAQRKDIFGFCLASVDDLTKFRIGEQVELIG